MSEALSPEDSCSLGLAERVRAVGHGLTPSLYELYSLDDGGNPAEYLGEVGRRRAGYLNDRPGTIDDKRRCLEHLRDSGFGTYLPDVYGHVEGGSFESERDGSLRDVVADEGRVVLKRYTGGSGKHVYVCTPDGDSIRLDGKHGRTHTFDEVSGDLESHLVTEYCRQAAYVDRIYPGAANTLRVLTLRTREGEVVVPAAVHRIGSERTGVLDNFSQGGMSAAVDLETGELTAAARPVDGRRTVWHESHPDTGARIAGTTVPGWDRIREGIRAVARGTPGFDHVGWDLVVTDPGEFRIIEANSHPNPDVVQVHGPLLADDEVRRFYCDHGIL